MVSRQAAWASAARVASFLRSRSPGGCSGIGRGYSKFSDERNISYIRKNVRAEPSRSTAAGSERDAVGRVEEDLLELARELDAPYQGRCGGQRAVLDAGRNHLIGAGGRIWLHRWTPGPGPLLRSGQDRGRPAGGGCEGEGHRQRVPERRIGEVETRVAGPHDLQPGVVGAAAGSARAVDDV